MCFFEDYRERVEDFNVSFGRKLFELNIEDIVYKVSEIMDIVSAVIYFDMFRFTNNDKWKFSLV